MKHIRRTISALLALMLVLAFGTPALAADKAELDKAITETAAYIHKTVKDPQIGSMGGEWAVIGLARSGYNVPDSYYENYYKTAQAYVAERKGVLDERKYTEYSRVILGLAAGGYDARNVAGYDLTAALGDFDKTVWQGINGPVFALIALDSLDYPVPENKEAKVQATRDLYIQEILRRQLADGGWNLSAGSGGAAVSPDAKTSPDLTGMVLQALAKYQARADVKAAVDKALVCLSAAQDSSGGYGSNMSGGAAASESTVQALVALCELGISVDDPRFVKNGNTLVDNLLSFKNADGSFKHTMDGAGDNQMSTEQALYGLAAAKRAAEGKNSLYRMSDAVKRGTFAAVPASSGTAAAPAAGQPVASETAAASSAPSVPSGLPGKNADVKAIPVTDAGKTFSDMPGHPGKEAVEALASRGLIGGKTETAYAPDAVMTRAEFSSVITKALGLTLKAQPGFADVPAGAWFAPAVGTVNQYGIASGTSASLFNPSGTITRQEAAVMVGKAAKLAGMDTQISKAEARDMLALFGDYTTAGEWAQASLAFCYKENILSQEDLNIEPLRSITRGEVAQMLYRMLGAAQLL